MTQPELGIRDEIYITMDTDEVAESIVILKEKLKEIRDQIKVFEYEIHCRLVQAGTNALPSNEYDIEIKYNTPEYDVSRIRSKLGELISGQELEDLIVPAHIKQLEVKEKVNGRKARSMINKYKGPIEEAIFASRIDKGRISISKRKETK